MWQDSGRCPRLSRLIRRVPFDLNEGAVKAQLDGGKPIEVDMFTFLRSFLAGVGFILTIVGIHDLYRRWAVRQSEKRESHRKIALLRGTDHFIAHIIQLGGESSKTYSMSVMGEAEGGYYLTPPNDFVSVGFGRSGSMVVNATDLSLKEGFRIDSVAGADRNFVKHRDPITCHLLLPEPRNDYHVKFVKSGESQLLGGWRKV